MMTDDSAHAQAKTPPSQPNPALKPLEGLVGDWEMEISNASFLPRPSDTVKGGPVSFEWVQDVKEEMMQGGTAVTIGAIVTGRRTYDLVDGWGWERPPDCWSAGPPPGRFDVANQGFFAHMEALLLFHQRSCIKTKQWEKSHTLPSTAFSC